MIGLPWHASGRIAVENAADPLFWRNVLVLDGYGANGGTSFPDRSKYGRTITANGDVQTSTGVAFAPGDSSIAFDGAGDWLSAAAAAEILEMRTAEWSVETMYRTNDAGADQAIFTYAESAVSTGAELMFGLAHYGAAVAGKVRGFTYDSTTQTAVDSTGALSAATDYHIAFSAYIPPGGGRTLYLHLNGVLQASIAVGTINNPTVPTLRIGRYENTVTRYVDGNTGRMRITVGKSRYGPDNFTPPKHLPLF
jgi:hypothetical protein